jgi:hypothetical protein
MSLNVDRAMPERLLAAKVREVVAAGFEVLK